MQTRLTIRKTRRHALASLLGAALITAFAPAAHAADTVVIAHAAGVNGQAVDRLLKDYAAQTGASVEGLTFSDTDYGAKMQLVARAGNPAFDIALGVPIDVFNLTKPAKIYANIDTAGWEAATLDAMKQGKLIEADHAVSQDTSALLVYSSKATVEPKTWGDFFDTQKFPGNRGVASGGLGVPINMEYALIAGGADSTKLHPLNYDAALKALGSLGSKLVLWDNAPKGIQDLVNGDTVMTWSYAPAALAALKAGQPIKLATPPGTVVARQLAVVMAKAPNGQAASQRFLAWWFKPENQTKYAEYTSYGIVVPSKAVLAKFTPEQQRYMPFSGPSPENFRVLNYGYYSQTGADGTSNLAETLKRWTAFRAK